MKDATTYQPAQQFGLLVAGDSGTGKSSLMLEFPGIYVVDCDRNLRSALDLYQRRHGTPKTDWWYDTPELDEAGRKLPPEAVWSNVARLIDKNALDSKVKAVGIDGLTRINDYLVAYIISKGGDMEKPIKVGGLTVMTKSLYQPFSMLMTQFVLALRQLGKPVVFTAHLRTGESEFSDTTVWQPNMVGSLRSSLPHLFTDYWLADTEQLVPGPTTTGTTEKPGPYPTGVKYIVRTAPRPQVKLKNSLGLPPVFEFTWEAFEPYLRRGDTLGCAKPPDPAAVLLVAGASAMTVPTVKGIP